MSSFSSQEIESAQLRLSLRILHRRVLLLGHQRNFFFLLALLFVATLAAIHLLPFDYSALAPLLIIGPGFLLHGYYFIELPAAKSILAFFERNHPELCSWLPESAIVEANLLHEQKAL